MEKLMSAIRPIRTRTKTTSPVGRKSFFESCEVVKTASRAKVENGKSKVEEKRCSASVLRPSTLDPWQAFTLIEMLVVIVILGILAGLAVPALKNIGKSDANTSAARQLLDDVGHARQLAISRHTTVYMVFVPTNFWVSIINTNTSQFPLLLNLAEKQLSGYGFFAWGALGDQPGNHQPHYLSEQWRSLPDNSYIASWKFLPQTSTMSVNTVNNGSFTVHGFNTNSFPFPAATNSPGVTLPFIAFNYLGQLTTNGVDPSYADEFIPLAQGSVSYGYDGGTKSPTLSPVSASDITETPPGNSTNSMFNLVHVDALTGRARLEFQKLP
jgi:prepilin-type N-terminal cleavage/methylation domain-containing protein